MKKAYTIPENFDEIIIGEIYNVEKYKINKNYTENIRIRIDNLKYIKEDICKKTYIYYDVSLLDDTNTPIKNAVLSTIKDFKGYYVLDYKEKEEYYYTTIFTLSYCKLYKKPEECMCKMKNAAVEDY